jgi:5-methylcytosine-specific restriction endonuclease McrA
VSCIDSCPRRRRPSGTGQLSKIGPYWYAGVQLRDGRRPRRRRYTEEDARQALTELTDKYRDELGWFYSVPHPYWFGQRPRPPRVGVTPSVRFAVFRRDGFRCTYCGAGPSNDRLTVDHVIAVANGGTDDLSNLVTACQTCNIGKGAA